MWLDCSALTDDSVAFTQMIREKTGLYLSEGAEFGGNGRDVYKRQASYSLCREDSRLSVQKQSGLGGVLPLG